MISINLLNGVKWTCRICKAEKPLLEFTIHRRTNLKSMAGVESFNREHICKPCGTQVNTIKKRRLKAVVIVGYGSKCSCPGCDVIEPAFLCLDHVVPCGIKKRIEQGGCEAAWRDALRRTFPPDYQLLCYNCNCAKQFNAGGCPHRIASGIEQQFLEPLKIIHPNRSAILIGRSVSEETRRLMRETRKRNMSTPKGREQAKKKAALRWDAEEVKLTNAKRTD